MERPIPGQPFRRSSQKPVLPREQQVRQGMAVNAALAALGSPHALAFLNSHHDGLGGRPLDIAIASADGLKAVEAVLQDPSNAAASAQRH